MDKRTFLNYLHEGDFTGLFTECGWGSPSSSGAFSVSIGESVFEFREVAQKGFRIYSSVVDAFPPVSIRRTLDAKLRKFSHSYFVIFTLKGEAYHHQWLVPVDAVDKRRIVPVEYADDTHAETLYEKVQGISFGMDETPTILDVVARVNTQFIVNASDVTKKFYAGFRKQHDAFVKKLEGMDDTNNRNWYASVMLNRLMFCYFIQKKGFFMDKFFNPDLNYLQNKLDQIISKKGPNKFFGSFYKGFLRGLFEDGLNSPKRSQKFIDTYGRIPYLNGGMFEAHQLEKQYPDIDVPDKVFVELFKFFDEWRWHLDDRIERDGRDINPDVLGYIFEQYINDRAQMGAYYTKEDITEYIGRNCILPFLFGAVQKADSKPFKPDGEVWKTLRASQDNYIFAAVKKGVELSLPSNIEKGVDTVGRDLRARRADWNKPAASAYALPTEIWRETVARRQRYAEVLEKITSGKITDIHDFITYNLNIRAFAEDLIRNTTDHLFVKHFYDALRAVTILDPTCGSGAFLFAALNILEPLYEACLDRMSEPAFVKYFKDDLNEIKDKYRSNRQYFIYKNIILRNLYGVDIMHEATEIARLRLFLKMVAVVEADPTQENLGLDPLPDVDFNIRCGNTLVGYASQEHLLKALEKADPLGLYSKDELAKISKKAADVADSCARFRKEQLSGNSAFYYRKTDLNKMIVELGDQLDATLAKMDYGIDVETANGKKAFAGWKARAQPFHWYSEFYNIIVDHGGFDVIIGNPPYVVYKEADCGYKTNGFRTYECKDLYAYVIERSVHIVHKSALFGMIVPISIVSTDGFRLLRNELADNCPQLFFSNYAMRPGKLFEGAEKHLSIFVASKCPVERRSVNTAKYYRWTVEERDSLFEGIYYVPIPEATWLMNSYPKAGSSLEVSILKKLAKMPAVSLSFNANGSHTLYHTRKLRYFVQFLDCAPIIYSADGSKRETSELKEIHFDTVQKRDSALASYLSNLFFWFFIMYSDCRNLNKREVDAFPCDLDAVQGAELARLGRKILKNLQDNSCYITAEYAKYGALKMQTFKPRMSKVVANQIDELLAKHYGFTEEELDFIINYDIKYRMGDELA